jgi:hypothetical protein
MKEGITDHEIKTGWVNPDTGEEGTFNKDGTIRKYTWRENIRNWNERRLSRKYQYKEAKRLTKEFMKNEKQLDDKAWQYYNSIGTTWGTHSLYINHRLKEAFARGQYGDFSIDYNALNRSGKLVKL